jgi:hypothetical protein
MTTWTTDRLLDVMQNIVNDPSETNMHTQIARLAEDECRHLNKVLFSIEANVRDREAVYDRE